MKRKIPLKKLKELVGEKVTVMFSWIGIEKEITGILMSVDTKKVIVDIPFSFSFLSKKTISFNSKTTTTKEISSQGKVIYSN